MFRNTLAVLIVALVDIVCVHGSTLLHYGTKTPYGTEGIPQAIADEYSQFTTGAGVQCNLKQVTGIYRHGARYMGKEYMEAATMLAGVIKQNLTQNSMSLKDWTNPFNVEEAMELSQLGINETFGLGERMAKKTKMAFANFGDDDLLLMSSSSSRSIDSAKYFQKGFFTELALPNIGMPAFSNTVNNTLTRFYDKCDRYTKTVKANATAIEEITKFKNSDVMGKLIPRIKEKIGVSDNFVITYDDVESMLYFCAIETGLFGSSPWCDLLEDQDLDILEYLDDLTNYWTEAYGHPINYEMACVLVSDVFKRMEAVVSEDTSLPPKAKFVFGHFPTLGPLVAALGLFKDNEQLRADNMADQVKRSFNSRKMLPLSANIVFVLYQCSESVTTTAGQKSYSDSNLVRLIHNERVITLPGCAENYCSYSYLREKFNDHIFHCDLKEMCDMSTSGTKMVQKSWTVLIVAFLWLLVLDRK